MNNVDVVVTEMEIFTNDMELRNKRKAAYAKIGNEIYSKVAQLDAETYKYLKAEFESGNKEYALSKLFEYSILHINNSLAAVYARYDVERYVDYEECLSFVLEKMSDYISKFTGFPEYFSQYANSTLNHYVYKLVVKKYRIAVKEFERYEFMPEKSVEWEQDKRDFEEFPIEVFTREEIHVRLQKVIDRLKPREIKVIKMRFGFDEYEEMTLQEIANRLGLTKGRIDQLLSNALKKLRKPKTNKEVRLYFKDGFTY